MLSIILTTKNVLTGERERITKVVFDQLVRLKDVEVIVSDYDSNDGIEDFVESYGFKFLHTPSNKGQFLNHSKTFNNAIIQAKGEYIAMAGADFILSDTYPEVIPAILKENNVVVLVPMYHIDLDTHELKLYRGQWRWIIAYRKEEGIKCGGYDERMYGWGHDDIDFVRRLVKQRTLKQVIAQDVLALHCWHDRKYADDCEIKQENPNWRVFHDNLNNNDKNIVNSYWSIKSEKSSI